MERLSGKRVLVTGGGGFFLGRRVCARLETTGVSEVIAPRRAEYDLVEPAAATRLLAESRPDVVIHLAAEVGGIGANQANPGRFFYANAMMGLNVIEAARVQGVEKHVQVGTVCAYPKHTPVPFREDDLWDGYPEETNAAYGLAKKALLVMLQAYREQYGLNGIYLMPVNLYGPGDDFDLENSHVIPALIRKCEEARTSGAAEVRCWGTGSASREFLYVDDCAEAVVLAAARYDGPEPVNVGSGHEIRVRDLASLIVDATGFTGELVWEADRPDGQHRRQADVSRARERFGFEASTPLEVGLTQTVGWYREREALAFTRR